MNFVIAYRVNRLMKEFAFRPMQLDGQGQWAILFTHKVSGMGDMVSSLSLQNSFHVEPAAFNTALLNFRVSFQSMAPGSMWPEAYRFSSRQHTLDAISILLLLSVQQGG